MVDYVGGFNRTNKRRPLTKPAPPEVIDETGHAWKCDRKDMHGHKCTRIVGPYFSRKLLADAIRSHIQAQHVNTLPSMNEPDKADARMARLMEPGGYEA